MQNFHKKLQHFFQMKVTLLVALFACFSLSSLQAQVKNQTPGTFKGFTSKTSALATGVGLQQFYSTTGKYTISADAAGSLSSSLNIRVNKPNAQATVEKAILISSVTNTTQTDGCVSLNNVAVAWDGAANISFFNNYWADVTNIVAGTINAFPAGISTLPLTECATNVIEGEALLVIFRDPLASEKTIIVMLGGQNPSGDNFSVTLAKPIDPKAAGALLDMGLGIGYSYQANGVNQASQVSVNGQRISSSAGGEDDGASANGGLITVGGIDDVDSNPADPFAFPTNPRSDDELYSILPFITDTTTSLTLSTANPSLDDNIFLAYFVTSGAAIIGEGILLSNTSDTAYLGESHTVKATIVDDNGQPVSGREVKFSIVAGPNAGNSFTATTDANGNAFYTYTGTTAGVDDIQACFTDSQSQTSCSNTVAVNWVQLDQSCKNICIVDNFGYKWRICYKKNGNIAEGTGTVNLGDGKIWQAHGWMYCTNGMLELHAINPAADACASGLVDSFVYKGISDEKCNMAEIHVGSGTFKSFCSGTVVNEGIFSAVNCGAQTDRVTNPDGVTPAKTKVSDIVLKVAPNPVQSAATISFTLAKRSNVNITIYNFMMQPVKTVFNGVKEAGDHSVMWNVNQTSNINAGLYKVVFLANGKTYTSTVQVIK